MSKRDDTISLRRMLDHAGEACAMVEGRERNDLSSDRMLLIHGYDVVDFEHPLGYGADRSSAAYRATRNDPEWPLDG